jgi:hypothetical protein
MEEDIYLGRDNIIELKLISNNTAQDLTTVTQMSLRIGAVETHISHPNWKE